jgi:hypothetical protein
MCGTRQVRGPGMPTLRSPIIQHFVMMELTTQADKVFLNVNGKRIAETSKNDRNSYSFSIKEPGATALFYGCEFGELPTRIKTIYLRPFTTELTLENNVYIKQEEASGWSIEIHSFVELELWNQIYTPTNFIGNLKAAIQSRADIGILKIGNIQSESYGLRLVFVFKDPSTKIGQSIERIVDIVKASELQAMTECLKEEKGKSLATYFLFPVEVKSACEQYLLYFADFLRDVGINASVELKEEADRVLFAVTPHDSTEALDRIRQVLDLYLGLPTATFTTTDEKEYRLEAQRLTVNVLHLKSQLILAQAMLETKNATIESQRERLIYQGRIIEGRLLPEPAQRKEPDTEEILGGAVEIKKYEGKGFAVNLPMMFRKLREAFKKA